MLLIFILSQLMRLGVIFLIYISIFWFTLSRSAISIESPSVEIIGFGLGERTKINVKQFQILDIILLQLELRSTEYSHS